MYSNVLYKDSVLNGSRKDQLVSKMLAYCGGVKNVHIKLKSARK